MIINTAHSVRLLLKPYSSDVNKATSVKTKATTLKTKATIPKAKATKATATCCRNTASARQHTTDESTFMKLSSNRNLFNTGEQSTNWGVES